MEKMEKRGPEHGAETRRITHSVCLAGGIRVLAQFSSSFASCSQMNTMIQYTQIGTYISLHVKRVYSRGQLHPRHGMQAARPHPEHLSIALRGSCVRLTWA
jgi:hypothetical protein